MSGKTKGFQLSSLTLLHFNFLFDIYRSGTIDERLMVALAHEGLKGIPREAEKVICPINREVISLVYDHYREGRKKIAIYRDARGQRYVAADFNNDPPETCIQF
jgi:hypothetical protein